MCGNASSPTWVHWTISHTKAANDYSHSAYDYIQRNPVLYINHSWNSWNLMLVCALADWSSVYYLPHNTAPGMCFFFPCAKRSSVLWRSELIIWGLKAAVIAVQGFTSKTLTNLNGLILSQPTKQVRNKGPLGNHFSKVRGSIERKPSPKNLISIICIPFNFQLTSNNAYIIKVQTAGVLNYGSHVEVF